MEKRGLYGGAITCEIPTKWMDVSTFRQVPDHQEVFVAKENGESVIIELLQMESTVMGNDVAEYYFNDLAKANGCEKESIQILHQLPLPKSCPILLSASASLSMVVGTQQVAKFNGTSSDSLLLYVAVFRIENVQTDLVIQYNVPHATHDTEEQRQPFLHFLATLQIQQWGLFG